MYKLTLTYDERRAFQWVGDRYNSGPIYRLLCCECEQTPDVEHDENVDITFAVPEHIAWQIRDLAEEEDSMWPCFNGTLTLKLNKFLSEIV